MIRLTDLFRPTEIVFLKHIVEHGDTNAEGLFEVINSLISKSNLEMSLNKATYFADNLCMRGWLDRLSITKCYTPTSQTWAIGHVLRAITPVSANHYRPVRHDPVPITAEEV